ncbi:hypothetical protein AB3X96_18065 [Paraburkholderia sp. BR13439]|uniref:hypothetical protein n=1 Tax=Paraburkholderia sp. BR13439 TaxID=3236996 RepID=UPI0034CE6FC5
MQPQAQRLFPDAPTREQLDAAARKFYAKLADLPGLRKETAEFRAAAARLVTAVPILRRIAQRGEFLPRHKVMRDWLLALTDADVAKLQAELAKEIEHHRRNLSPDDIDFFWNAKTTRV